MVADPGRERAGASATVGLVLGAGLRVLGGVEGEAVLGSPGDRDVLADPGPCRAVVLLHDHQFAAPGHPDEVLVATPVKDTSVTSPLSLVPASLLAEPQLLRAHPEPDVADPAGTWSRETSSLLPLDVDHHHTVGRLALDRRTQEVGLAEEVGDERRVRVLVERRRVPDLLEVPRSSPRWCRPWSCLLVVRDVHEGQPDLGLDALQLDLHLPTQP